MSNGEFNRRFNSNNPYQGKEERVLCICSAGLLRSPTVAAVMWNMGYNTRAAGIDTGHALIPVDGVLAHWADSYVVMDESIGTLLKTKFPHETRKKTIYNFNIEDMYERNNEELIEVIKERVSNRDDYKLLQEESQTQTEEG